MSASPYPVATLLLGSALALGCSSEAAPNATGGGGGAADSTTATVSTGAASSSSTGVYSTCGLEIDSGLRPKAVPEGWLPWTCNPGCEFWIPPDQASMPSPIEWEACPAYATHPCNRMSTPWSDGDGWALRTDVSFAPTADGGALLHLGRIAWNGNGDADSYVESVIGDVDGGPLEFAMRWRNQGCGASAGSLSSDVFSINLVGAGGDAYETDVDALMLGHIGSLDPVMPYRDANPGLSQWYSGPTLVVRLDHGSKLTAYPHDLSSSFDFYSPAMNPDHAEFSPAPLFFGSEALFTAADYNAAAVWAYDEGRGPHPLVSFPGDTSRGAFNIGSDGVDMVWNEGEGKEPNTRGWYPTVSIMTAPYTTDPAEVKGRRLRADPNPDISQSSHFAVGCGYGAKSLGGVGVQIVRLSDGAGWFLEPNAQWRPEVAVGVTCEFVFIQVNDVEGGQGPAIARVPIASLGKPLPPD
ncbi:MAG: hypothetical protein HOV80_18535 [Polyangiaceae bacterium]|nr:hypothetical protein [Polyangiaceae bacterium]